MGNLTNKVKKKKSRQKKIKIVSLVTIATAVAFFHAASALYLREMFNVKTLLPMWEIPKSDTIFTVGDLTILKYDMAVKILGDNILVISEQIQLVAILLLFAAVVYMIGKSMLDRFALFMFVGGLFSILYYGFLFALLRWPDSLLSKDVISFLPTPVIVPVYMPILLGALVFIGGVLLVFKKK